MRAFIVAAAAVAVSFFAPTARAEPAPELARLSWMIGSWTFEDTATPAAGFSYAESGERVCAWTLEQRYIECLSTGRTARVTRTYRHLWTWNEETRRLELISLFGNTPSRGLAVGTVSEDGRSIDVVTPPEVDDGQTDTYRYTIRYDGARSYQWDSSRHRNGDPPDQWVVRFIDRAVRADG